MHTYAERKVVQRAQKAATPGRAKSHLGHPQTFICNCRPGHTGAVAALLDRLLHHAHVLKCGPRSWRTKVHTDLRPEELTK